tara:strand:+ start:50627 stop:51487 length:861 start_codon:yes stop_codon:yes gene_type:complete
MFVSSTILACSEDDTCIEESSWHLGIAIGIGVKTNPLVDGEDIPLVILPDIAWYGEKAYFDNGELGYQWLSQPNFAFETFLTLDRESTFFSFLHPANILAPTQGSSIASPGSPDKPDFSGPTDSDKEDILINQRSLSINDIATRKWAIHGGLRGHYFSTVGEWQLALLQDISDVHKGQLVALQYSQKWLWRDVQMRLRLGADWKSARLLDYYYGVSKRDTTLSEYYFDGQSGWQTYLSFNVLKPINENWSWLAKMSYRRLPNSLTDSPLIEQNSISSVFLGVAYRF